MCYVRIRRLAQPGDNCNPVFSGHFTWSYCRSTASAIVFGSVFFVRVYRFLISYRYWLLLFVVAAVKGLDSGWLTGFLKEMSEDDQR